MSGLTNLERVYRYHDGTKHDFNRFARSLGYLDWASQPRPFRSFEGSPVFSLVPASPARSPEEDLLDPPVTAETVGRFLRYSLGLSAWKAFKGSRWSLRVNPSSGNLHPTEAYVVTPPLADLGETPGVWHYAPDRHAIERRCSFDRAAWTLADPGDAFLVALTSIHWRESWKYGERAFRYCQHDLGHAIAALGLSAALWGWRVTMLRGWPQREIAALTGVDRDEDFVEAEREEPACLLLVTRGLTARSVDVVNPARLEAVRNARWFGRASQLSEDHVRWSFIDEVARATEDAGHPGAADHPEDAGEAPSAVPQANIDRRLILQRRSALAFDGLSFTDRETFLRMMSRTMPAAGAPWDAVWWSPRVHLALFVHRVEGMTPGLYVLARAPSAVPRLRAKFSRDFAWTPAAGDLPLWLLKPGDFRSLSERVSCDQEIAGGGFFSLGMVADFDASLDEYGPSFYRRLFWESGVVGQVLYVEAEAAGARATGIGCFYDDPVHQLLGLEGHAFQSLYHFTVGMPVEDGRLTTEPGYAWERV